MSLLSTENLTVGWGTRAVLNLGDVDFNAGEIVVIAGPNGCGKSTALKTLARQIPPISGLVTADGGSIWTIKPRDFARRVAYVPQLLEPPREMLLEEFVALGRNPHQSWWSWQTSEADRQCIENAMLATSVSHLRKNRLVDMSGGERQRAVIAGAIAQETSLIILDEPTAHLDFKHQLQLLQLLQELRASGMAIILVLHDLNLMARLADRIILLRTAADGPGRIAAEGAPENVLTREILRQVYEVDVSITADPQTGFTIYSPTTPVDTSSVPSDDVT